MRSALGETLCYQEIVSSGPACLPVHRDDLKRHANLGTDVTSQDRNIDDYIRDAVQSVEQDSGRALVMQTRKLYLSEWPIDAVELRGCPIQKVDSVSYVDHAADTQAWTDYQLNLADEPARLRPAWGGYWPSARQQEKSICVTYKAGYIIPFTATTADVLTLSGYTPTNGDVYRLSNSGGHLPEGLATGTDYYVVQASGSTCKLSLTAGGSAVDITGAGTGLSFLGELNPMATLAIYLRVAMAYVDREGAEWARCERGYWSKIYSLRYEGV